jgi:hypothetical protein
LTKKFSERKTFGLVAPKVVCVLQNMLRLLCTVVDGLRSWFLKRNVRVLLWSVNGLKILVLSTQWMMSVLLECALGSNIRQVILVHLFIAVSENAFEENVRVKFSVKSFVAGCHGDVDVFSRLPCAFVALIYCQVLTHWHIHSEKHVDREKISGTK